MVVGANPDPHPSRKSLSLVLQAGTGRLLVEKLSVACHEGTAALRSPNAPALKGAHQYANLRVSDAHTD